MDPDSKVLLTKNSNPHYPLKAACIRMEAARYFCCRLILRKRLTAFWIVLAASVST